MRTGPAVIRGRRTAPVLVLAGLALASLFASRHAPLAGDTIDGFLLGSALYWSPPVGPIDPALEDRLYPNELGLATSVLDRRDPGHARLISVQEFADGIQPARDPGPLVSIFVFTLADGSVHATAVSCADSAPCGGLGSYPG